MVVRRVWILSSVCALALTAPVSAQRTGPYWGKDHTIGTRAHDVGFDGEGQTMTADVNGDGRLDYVYNDEGTRDYNVLLNRGDGTLGSDTDWGTREHGVGFDGEGQWLADLDGDGRADYVYNDSNTRDYRVMLSTGTRFGTDTNWGTRDHGVGFDGAGQWFADLNGDGRADYIYNDSSTRDYRVMLSNGSGFDSDTLWGTREHGVEANYAQWVVDVTGDGQADYVYNDSNTNNYYVMVSNGTGFEDEVLWGSRSEAVGFSSEGQWLADMNGDGRADLVYNADGTRDYHVMLSTGSGFEADSNWGTRVHGVGFDGDGQWLVDMNGDGLADYVYNDSNTRDYWVMFSTGSGFGPDHKFATRRHGVADDGLAQWFADINSDGFADYVYGRSSSDELRALVSADRASETVTMVIISDGQPYWGDDDLNVSLNERSITAINAVTRANGGQWPSCTGGGAIQQPAAIIINGDLTENFHSDEVESYESWYHRSADYLILPGLGNHDYANNVGSDHCTTANPFTWGNGSSECAERAVQYIRDTVTGEDVYYFNRDLITLYDDGTPAWDPDSLAYSFDLGPVHFVQLHNYPTYAASEIDISSSIDWLRTDLQQATDRGQNIVLNFHDYGEHMHQDNQQFLDAIAGQNVVALFAGHIHQDYGRMVRDHHNAPQYDNVYGTDIPFFRSGGVISVNEDANGDKYPVGKFLLVEFGPDYMRYAVMNYLDEDNPPEFYGGNTCGITQEEQWHGGEQRLGYVELLMRMNYPATPN